MWSALFCHLSPDGMTKDTTKVCLNTSSPLALQLCRILSALCSFFYLSKSIKARQPKGDVNSSGGGNFFRAYMRACMIYVINRLD